MTTTTEHAPKPPTLRNFEPPVVVDMLVHPSQVRIGDSILVRGVLAEVTGTRESGAEGVTEIVTEHASFAPASAVGVFAGVEDYVAVRRYVTGQAASVVARGSARDIAQELDNALTGHGPTEVDRDLGLAGEQLTGLLEQARDTLEKVAAADTAEYALGDLLPDDWGKWSSVPGTALARYLRAALAVAERHLGRLPVPGDEDIPGGRL